MDKQRWFRGLQVLRGILFLLVFVSHSGAWYDVKGFRGGECGVSGFFVLSGFLSSYYFNPAQIHGKMIKAGLLNLWKKLKKFYPLYFVFLVLSIPVVRNEPHNNMINYLKASCLIQSYWGEASTALCYNWPSWFLSSICLAYWLSPFLNMICWKGRRYSWIGMAVIFGGLVFWGTFWKYAPSSNSGGYYYMYICPWIRLFDYVEGILLSNIFKSANKDPEALIWTGAWIMECIVFLSGIFALRVPSFIPEVYRWSVMWLPISLGMVWCFASIRGPVTLWLSSREYLLWLGARSFELYISHRMILLFFERIKVGWAYFLAISAILIVSECAYQGAKKWHKQEGGKSCMEGTSE